MCACHVTDGLRSEGDEFSRDMTCDGEEGEEEEERHATGQTWNHAMQRGKRDGALAYSGMETHMMETRARMSVSCVNASNTTPWCMLM